MFVLVICVEILNYYSNFKKKIHFLNHYKTLFWDHIVSIIHTGHIIFFCTSVCSFVCFFCFRHWNHVNKKDKKEQIVNHNMWAWEKKGRRLENYSSFNSYGTEIIYIYKSHIIYRWIKTMASHLREKNKIHDW
jgi:predicted membrane protein